jgi:steroid 5-alpha reductase family enzyme
VIAIVVALAIDAAVSIALFALLWALCVRLKDVTMVDAFWALGLLVLAAAAFLQSVGAQPRKLLLLGLCALWALRLGGYLLWRWRDHGPDRRYRSLLGKAQAERGWSFAKASLLLVFAVQAPLQFIVSLPVQLGQLSAVQPPLGLLGFAGAGLALLGFVFESVGDWQLTRFRKNPDNAGAVLNTGLWRYTRHPNYFGDACVWWGLYLIAAETPPGVWSLPGPILITWLLTRWSGAPILENKMRKTRPDYVRYIETTSGFVPWLPKR